jgi:hypothetical protein
VNPKRAFLPVLLAAMFLATPGAWAGSKTLMVHYMPWFVSKPYSGLWGWHWTMGSAGINPDIVTNGQSEIASWYYPLIGPYDSADPKVLEFHVLLMKLSGVDGVLVDWDGPDNFNDYQTNNVRMAALFNYTRKAGLKFGVVCEPWTIQTEITAGFITSNNAIAHEQGQMLYLQTNYFTDPGFLRLNGGPVLLDFGEAYFTSGTNWTNIFSVLQPTNQPAFFNEDNPLKPPAVGAFDWPPMWLSQTNSGILTDAMMQSYLAGFDQNAKGWAAAISSAWPRFHDYYAQAGAGASNGYLDDQSGATFRETLARAMTNSAAIIQVATWNDFGEGTIIEPTVQYGYRDLGVLQDFRRQYLDATFPYHTNDLDVALRLYHLRQQYTNNPVIAAELDRIFTNAVAGRLAVARQQLTGIETKQLELYNPAVSNGQLQFDVGGYLQTNGVIVQASSNLTGAAWSGVSTNSGGTNLIVFSTNVPAQSPPVFFKAQSAGQ